MAYQKCWDHNEEEESSERNDHEKIRIEADERVDAEKGECMGWCLPGEEAYEAILENEDYANSKLESQHSRQKVPGYYLTHLALK